MKAAITAPIAAKKRPNGTSRSEASTSFRVLTSIACACDSTPSAAAETVAMNARPATSTRARSMMTVVREIGLPSVSSSRPSESSADHRATWVMA